MSTDEYTPYLLPLDQFMKAIQDKGMIDKKDERQIRKFPVIEKFAKALIDHLYAKKSPSLPSNKSRGKISVVTVILKVSYHEIFTAIN